MPDSTTDLDRGQARARPGATGASAGSSHRKLHAHPVTSLTTKIVVGVVGLAVASVGVVMIVTPGPAFVLIPLGLAILATEFAFARRWLGWARDKAMEAKRKSEDDADPAVRRRRLVLTGLPSCSSSASWSAYVSVYDWPAFAVAAGTGCRALAGWVPDLPAM